MARTWVLPSSEMWLRSSTVTERTGTVIPVNAIMAMSARALPSNMFGTRSRSWPAMILTSRPTSSASVSAMSLLAFRFTVAVALAPPKAVMEKVLAPAIMSALVRVASTRSPLRLRSEAPLPTLILETESALCVATATVTPKPERPSTRTLSTRLMVESVSMRNTPACVLETVRSASAAMSTVEPKRLALLPRWVVLAIALTEPALAEKDSSEFSLLLYLFLTAWLVA